MKIGNTVLFYGCHNQLIQGIVQKTVNNIVYLKDDLGNKYEYTKEDLWKTAVLQKENIYLFGTVEQVATYIADSIMSEKGADDAKKFQGFDFAVDSDFFHDSTLEDMKTEASGWYGCHSVNLGFDSWDIELASNYYGGGAACIREIGVGEDKETVIEEIIALILNPVRDTENQLFSREDRIFVELEQEKDED